MQADRETVYSIGYRVSSEERKREEIQDKRFTPTLILPPQGGGNNIAAATIISHLL